MVEGGVCMEYIEKYDLIKSIILNIKTIAMALIFCPECGNQVSEYAETCNNCSYPIAKRKLGENGFNQAENPDKETNQSEDKSSKTIVWDSVLYVLLIAITIWFVCLIFIKMENEIYMNKKKTDEYGIN